MWVFLGSVYESRSEDQVYCSDSYLRPLDVFIVYSN